MIYCPSCGHVAHTRRAHFMDDGTKDNDCTVPEYLLLCDI